MSTFVAVGDNNLPILNVSPSVGIRRKVFTGTEIPNLKRTTWVIGNVHMSDGSIIKTYEVLFNIKKSGSPDDFGILLRPRKKYMDTVFESLFNFNCNCENYTSDRVIGVRECSFTRVNE